jgi:hypothetical protein
VRLGLLAEHTFTPAAPAAMSSSRVDTKVKLCTTLSAHGRLALMRRSFLYNRRWLSMHAAKYSFTAGQYMSAVTNSRLPAGYCSSLSVVVAARPYGASCQRRTPAASALAYVRRSGLYTTERTSLLCSRYAVTTLKPAAGWGKPLSITEAPGT